MIVLGGLVLAVLTYLVRGRNEVVRVDSGVAEWGDRTASGFATDVLTGGSDRPSRIVFPPCPDQSN